MAGSVSISLKLDCFVRQDGQKWISLCPGLNVASQGSTEEGAIHSLREAVLEGTPQHLRLLGCVDSRIKGDHLVMSRPDLARPVVIKMENDLGRTLKPKKLRQKTVYAPTPEN